MQTSDWKNIQFPQEFFVNRERHATDWGEFLGKEDRKLYNLASQRISSEPSRLVARIHPAKRANL